MAFFLFLFFFQPYNTILSNSSFLQPSFKLDFMGNNFFKRDFTQISSLSTFFFFFFVFRSNEGTRGKILLGRSHVLNTCSFFGKAQSKMVNQQNTGNLINFVSEKS